MSLWHDNSWNIYFTWQSLKSIHSKSCKQKTALWHLSYFKWLFVDILVNILMALVVWFLGLILNVTQFLYLYQFKYKTRFEMSKFSQEINLEELENFFNNGLQNQKDKNWIKSCANRQSKQSWKFESNCQKLQQSSNFLWRQTCMRSPVIPFNLIEIL